MEREFVPVARAWRSALFARAGFEYAGFPLALSMVVLTRHKATTILQARLRGRSSQHSSSGPQRFGFGIGSLRVGDH